MAASPAERRRDLQVVRVIAMLQPHGFQRGAKQDPRSTERYEVIWRSLKDGLERARSRLVRKRVSRRIRVDASMKIVRSVSQIRFGKQSKLPPECQIKIDGSTTPCDTMFIAVDRWIHCRLGQVRQRCETVASSSMTRTRKIYTVGKTTAVGVGPTTDWQPRSREFAHGDRARWLEF